MEINTEKKEDIFDRLSRKMREGRILTPRKKDIFDRIQLPAEEKAVIEIKKILPGLIKEALSGLPKPVPQIVKETRVEIVKNEQKPPKVDTGLTDALKAEISSLREEIKALKRQVEDVPIPGGPGVIGIPAPEGNEGKFLKVVKNKAEWTTGGSGVGLSGYTVNNHSETKTFDANDTSLDELADVVGTIISELS